MSRITQKLKSEGGASLIISLIFFLTAFMVGTVVLSSATANSDKLIARRAERQRYFALSSASRFLRTTIEGTKGEAWEERTIYGCVNSPLDITDTTTAGADNRKHQNPPTAYSGDPTGVKPGDMIVTKTDNRIQALLTKTAYEMYEKLRTDPNASIEKKFDIEVDGMETVGVTLTMSNDYSLSLVLKVQEEVMGMTVPVDKKETSSNDATTACTHEYNKTVTNSDGTEGTEVATVNFDINKPRTTLEVTWPTAQITKGVAP